MPPDGTSMSGDVWSPSEGGIWPPSSGKGASSKSNGDAHPPSPCRPLLYVYGADGGDGHGVCGVTDVFGIAERRLVAALLAMPNGASGDIRLAFLDILMLPYPSYRYGTVVTRAWRDARTGTVRVATNPSPRDIPGRTSNERFH